VFRRSSLTAAIEVFVLPEAKGGFGRLLCLTAMMMRSVTIGAVRLQPDLSIDAAGRRRRRRRSSGKPWCLGRVFLTWPDAGRWIRSRSIGGGREGVTPRRTMRRSHAAEPVFVPIVTDATSVGEAAPTALAASVIEVRLAGAVVRVVSGLDDAQLTAVLRAVRASVLRP
jgi:hypothetical protein